MERIEASKHSLNVNISVFCFLLNQSFFFVGKFTLPSLKTVKPSSDDLKLSAMSP